MADTKQSAPEALARTLAQMSPPDELRSCDVCGCCMRDRNGGGAVLEEDMTPSFLCSQCWTDYFKLDPVERAHRYDTSGPLVRVPGSTEKDGDADWRREGLRKIAFRMGIGYKPSGVAAVVFKNDARHIPQAYAFLALLRFLKIPPRRWLRSTGSSSTPSEFVSSITALMKAGESVFAPICSKLAHTYATCSNPHCTSAGELLTCKSCLVNLYCSQACQRAHRRAHKANCAAAVRFYAASKTMKEHFGDVWEARVTVQQLFDYATQ